MHTNAKTPTRLAGALLASVIVTLAVATVPALAAGPSGLTANLGQPDVTVGVTVDCGDFDCGTTEVIAAETPIAAPEPDPVQLKWVEYLVRQLRVVVKWMAVMARF